MFYTYRQNNSGGSFDIDEDRGISITVIVEADTARQADAKAQDIGIYFDENYEIDCNCCGTRWSAQGWDWGVEDSGTESPTIYGEPIHLVDDYSQRWVDKGVPSIYVHHKDGSIVGHNPG